jgi:hypothetical protein
VDHRSTQQELKVITAINGNQVTISPACTCQLASLAASGRLPVPRKYTLDAPVTIVPVNPSEREEIAK